MHSTDFFSAEDYLGKRVVVVGAGSSGKKRQALVMAYLLRVAVGHDIAHDFANHEVDVTMFVSSGIVSVFNPNQDH